MTTRRHFLRQANCAALSSAAVLNTLLHLKLGTRAAANGLTAGTDCRSLVCVFLNGGNDSWNWLVPRDGRHADYSVARNNLAIPSGSLVPLTQAAGGDGLSYGLHPSCEKLGRLFNGTSEFAGKRRLSFLTNAGTLLQPTTVADYAAGLHLPKALFSHSDQIEQWQTSVPQGMAQLTGWAGRAADVLHSAMNAGSTSMSISLGGNNILQTGRDTVQFVIGPDGSESFTRPQNPDDPADPLLVKNRAMKSLMEQHYANVMDEAFARITRNSIAAQDVFQAAFDSFDSALLTIPLPPGNYLAVNLRAAAKVIYLREVLGLRRQTFFVQYGGWDHHQELLTAQAGMLTVLSEALFYFQRVLEGLGLADSVLTYTASDFGRTLRSNGRGTDHAWGGNLMVMGGPVQGGRVYGQYPALSPVTVAGNDTRFGPLDVGYGGRFLPTMSTDVIFAEMLQWLGVTTADMPWVLPNLSRFTNLAGGTPPVGFLAT